MKKTMIMVMVQKNGQCIRMLGDKAAMGKKKGPVAADPKVKDK